MRNLIIALLTLCTCCSLWADTPKSVAIFTYYVAGASAWDPDTIKEGITGSEEAVIYMSQELAKLGYRVVVIGNPPVKSRYLAETSNPRYVPMGYRESQPYDIGIVWRQPSMINDVKGRAKQYYFWPHEIGAFDQPDSEINSYEDIMWLSKWQRENWIERNKSYSKFTNIYGNGILPSQFEEITERPNPYSCIYGSNYARGLAVLLDIWPDVKAKFPKATLDIYYGWQHWGQLAPHQELKMRAQVYLLGPLGVTDHGLVDHETLNKAYAKASFWTYPCVLPETFCITGLRAQLSGAVPVILDGSALRETVCNGFRCQHLQDYFNTLVFALQNAETISVEDRKTMGKFIMRDFTWEAVAKKWKATFDLHAAQPTAISI